MGKTSIPGDSSPLSSIPDSEGLSLPSLSQPPQPHEAEAASRPREDAEMVDHLLPAESPMPSTRPKRTRAAPTLKKDAPKKIAKRTPKKKKKWDAENILTDPKSPLATADLRSLLSNPQAWTLLSSPEKQEILSLLPSQTPLVPSEDPEVPAQPDIAALRNDDTFRHDCTTYTENLAEGRFEADWLVSAWAAHERRKVGVFDEFLVETFEETWEVELPEAFKPKREKRDEVDEGEKQLDVSGEGKSEGKMEKADGASEKDDGDKSHRDQDQPKSDISVETTEAKQQDAAPEVRQPGPTDHAQNRASSTDQTMATVSDVETTHAPETESMADASNHAQSQQSPTDKPMITASNTETGQDGNEPVHEEHKDTKPSDGDRMVVDELQAKNSPLKKEQRTPLPHLVQRSNNRMEVDGEDSEDELA